MVVHCESTISRIASEDCYDFLTELRREVQIDPSRCIRSQKADQLCLAELYFGRVATDIAAAKLRAAQ